MIKTIRILLAILFFAVTACQKEDFFDKFPPEIMFFENNKVENADFNQVTLPQDTTAYQVKARVSSPFKLKEIKIFAVVGNNETLLNSINNFGSTPNEFFVYQDISGISGNMDVKFVAWDTDGRQSSKTFKILFN